MLYGSRGHGSLHLTVGDSQCMASVKGSEKSSSSVRKPGVAQASHTNMEGL